MFCENCGAQIPDDSRVCEMCGYYVAADSTGIGSSNAGAAAVFKPQNAAGKKSENEILKKKVNTEPNKKTGKKVIGIAAAIIAFIGILAVVIILILPVLGNKETPLVYQKDDGIYAMKNSSKEPYLISEDADLSDCDNFYCYFLEDGNMIFPDHYDEKDGTYDIYLRDPKVEEPSGNNEDEKGLQIASDVSDYQYYDVAGDESGIIYYKGFTDSEDTDSFGGKLYYNDFINEIKLDSNVCSYVLGDGVIYYEKYIGDEETTLYGCELKPDAENVKIAEHVGFNDFRVEGSTVYYKVYDDIIEDNEEIAASKLYMKELGKDKIKIDQGEIGGFYITADGYVYYEKVAADGGALYDYVSDNMLEKDEAIVEPDASDYQTEVEDWYGSYYETDYDSYYSAQDAYYEKQSRDSLRNYLKSTPPYEDMYSIYSFNGKEAQLMCASATNVAEIVDDFECRGLSYNKIDLNIKGPVVDLADLDGEYDIFNYLSDDETSDLCAIIAGGKETVLRDDTEIDYYEMRLYGDVLACLDREENNLYTGKISDGKIEKLEPLDHDVSEILPGYFTGTLDDLLYYYKDEEDNHSDFYEVIDGKPKKMASDIYTGNIKMDANTYYGCGVFFLDGPSDFIYLADYEKGVGGTAYLIKNGQEKVRIADDVHYVYYCAGEIYYIQDYDYKGPGGDLYKFIKDGKTQKIDEDVVAVLSW